MGKMCPALSISGLKHDLYWQWSIRIPTVALLELFLNCAHPRKVEYLDGRRSLESDL